MASGRFGLVSAGKFGCEIRGVLFIGVPHVCGESGLGELGLLVWVRLCLGSGFSGWEED